jgi:hypothetical protein
VAASKCPLRVPHFVYGEFNGAKESGAGYSPSFEPYWCGKWTGISTFSLKKGATPGGHVESWNATQLAEGHATLHMTRGSTDIWANFQWQVEGLSSTNDKGSGTAHNGSSAADGGDEPTLLLGRGGVQFPRGSSGMGWWFIDGVLAELDSANEWYFDPPTRRLYWWPNSTTAEEPTEAGGTPVLVAARLQTLIRVTGARVHLANLTFAHTERTVLEPYETPSGGGYSVHRGAMVEMRDTDGSRARGGRGNSSSSSSSGGGGAMVFGCKFDSPGGNGMLVEGHSRGVKIVGNEFKWVGDSAIVVLGRTEGGGCDARGDKGSIPIGTVVESNLIREVGVWGKQGAGYFQALAMNSSLTSNIIFNGPRAGVLWNDGLGGGNTMTNNLLFNLVRETTDHGPFNRYYYI